MIEDDTPNVPPPESSSGDTQAKSIYLVSYPKIVFLYPTLIMALVAGFYYLFTGAPAEGDKDMMSLIFLIIFGANLVVLSFDFPRTTSLTFFFVGVVVFLAMWLISKSNPKFLPFLGDIFASLKPMANPQFYFIFAGILILIYIAVAISVQFDYWEVRPNELLHHHGILSDLERFSAPNLRIDKEINDLFEYVLLRAGRLILHPSHERRAVVLENVFFINRKETQITRMLGAVQVQVRSSDHPS